MATAKPTAGKPVAVFFQEVVLGDLRKFNAESNDSPTGGGARDLRISPVTDYWERLLDFFPERVSDREYYGYIHSGESRPKITLMGPTVSRHNECRICRISQINAWYINQQEYDDIIAAGHKWIYLLILDDQGRVWASKFSTDKLHRMHPNVTAAIKPLLTGNQTIRGFVTFN